MSKPSHPLLDSLKKDIEFYNDAIEEVALDILQNQLSEYPIFIAHQHKVELGENIIDKDELQTNWSINATILEELQERNILSPDRIQSFKDVFKNPRKYICVFLITKQTANFIFLPYKRKYLMSDN
jgi:hypothetical protein